MAFAAPVQDMRFALEGCAGLWALRAQSRFSDIDEDLLAQVLEAAGDLATGTIAPLNRSGDRARITLDDGVVRTAAGFREAYTAFRSGGWQGLSAPVQFGGQGLPRAVALAVMEMAHAANMSFALAPMLTAGAIEALDLHGDAEQQAHYLPRLISGEWTGTMNLTEPQAGSDLGALTTKATPAADGSYRLTGQKIFITWGEHDLTENIVHLVLARIEGAPAGSKGVSLFIAPKVLADGGRNGVRCIGVEEKMGIHASPTCTMSFENATGWLVGAENRGLAAMFTMMNAARLNVGAQGVGIAEAAYQKADAYARERKQGGALICEHPDVKRMLLAMRGNIQIGRALCYACAVAADAGDTAREDLLTPLAKAWCTDMGVETASLGVQVHGGMGYVEEGGAAQFYRDARIAPIYEGTNGIQAIDLYGRKLLSDRGQSTQRLIDDAREAARVLGRAPAGRLTDAAHALADATEYMVSADRPAALAGASEYLKLAAETAGAALVARGLAARNDARQRDIFCFFCETVLARAPSRLAGIRIGTL